MTSVSRLPLFVTVQRHHFDTSAGDHPRLRHFRQRLQQAREQGLPVILVQWDGGLFPQTPDTFSRDWVLHPDIRAEDGDLLVRASGRDPFSGELIGGQTLAAQLQAMGVTELDVLAVPDAPELTAVLDSATQYGLTLHVLPLDQGA
ncbi:isochorismatase [Deinococcus sp. Marseille-Q6407]|uniref:isochorismatase n=1 Tax=Deinococcus sp. Marseille-Q6407 TaxID=2969223 RepID=UPI0021C0D741|nr:isochorismatase [Deinococcus sp. Marseille-Q6407]